MRTPSGIVVAAVALAATAAFAGQKIGEPQAQRPPEKVYAVTCGYCHGANVGPVILGRNLPAATISTMVRHGRNAMPAFRPTEISNAELDALAAWVAASKPNAAEKGR